MDKVFVLAFSPTTQKKKFKQKKRTKFEGGIERELFGSKYIASHSFPHIAPHTYFVKKCRG